MKKLMAADVVIGGGCLLMFGAAALQMLPTEGDRAADAYHDLRLSGASNTQLCRSAKVVEQTYRASGQANEAEQWKLYAQIDCSGAYFNEGYRY